MRDKKGKFQKGHPKIQGAGGQIGNQNATKLKTPELKAEAYRQYCAYIATGGTKEAWVFEHPEVTLTHQTMEKYIEENPFDFPPIHKKIAESKSYEHWLKIGIQMMLGEIKNCQPAIYQMFMRNKFKWDKEEQNKIVEHAAVKVWEFIKNSK
jgi:hypothetical protein